MVNLNMIDTVGSGIRRVYDIQKKKFFPMPDYDLSEDNRVKVILYGKIIDEKYSKILFEKTNLDIDKVMLLDRVQKSYPITKEQSEYLKKDNLVEGRYPNIYISSNIAKITNDKENYIYNTGLENENLIIKYISEYEQASRKEIINLLKDKLPSSLNEKTKISRIRYLLQLLKKEDKIYNDNKSGHSCWKLKQQNCYFLLFFAVFLLFFCCFIAAFCCFIMIINIILFLKIKKQLIF